MQTKKMKPTKNQKRAIVHKNGNCVVFASSGSGKTKCLTERVKNLVDNYNIPQEIILCTTFSKKATDNMLERLGEQYNRINVYTFHALGYKMLRETNYFKGNYQPISIWELKKIIEDVVIELGLEGDREEIEIGKILTYISTQKAYLRKHNDEQIEYEDMLYDVYKMQKIYKYYEKYKTQKRKIDFDDMILHMYFLLRDNETARKRYSNQYQYVLCDEFQDFSKAQYEIIKLLCKDNNNLFVVGDPLQCWSGDNKVKTLDGIKKVKELKIGDMVEAVKKQEQIFSKITNISKSKAKTLDIITSGGNKIETTYNHRYFATQPVFEGKYIYVYLMYREDKGYRVGIAKGGNSGSLRCRLVCEGADKMWLIKQFENKNDACFFENYISLKYQIPTNPFLYNGRGLNLNQEGLNDLFKEFGKNGEQVLSDYDLLFDYPNYSKEIQSMYKKRINILMNHKKHGCHVFCESHGERIRRCFATYKEGYNFAYQLKNELTGVVAIKEKFSMGNRNILDVVTASQLMVGMKIPVVINGKIVLEDIVEINKKENKKDVFDIEVEETGNLVANNILSHNCIYTFRNCDNQYFLNFHKDWKDTTIINLGLNFRSTPNIVKLANKLVQGTTETTHDNYIESEAFNKPYKDVEYEVYDTDKEEAREISHKILDMVSSDDNNSGKNKYEYKDMMVLIRTNYQSQAIEDAFFEHKIPYIGMDGRSFYDRKEIKIVLSYLRLIDSLDNDESFEFIANKPNRFLGKVFMDEVSLFARKNNISMFESMLRFPRKNEWRYKKGIDDIINIIRNAKNRNTKNVGELVEYLRKIIDIDKFVSKDLDDMQDNEKIDNLDKFTAHCTDFKTVKELLYKIDAIQDFNKENQKNANKVQIMTIHKSKGLESTVVFLPSINQNILPHYRSIDDTREERRLLYVGMTRAEKELYMSSIRFSRNSSEPSQFLYDIFDDVDIKFGFKSNETDEM